MAIKLQGTNSVAAPGLTNDGGDGVVVETDSVDISIGGVSKVNVDSSGNTTCSGKVHITDDLASGQLLVGTSTSDATTKYGTFNVPHKTNSEEPVMVIGAESTTSDSQAVYIGGGFSTQNAAKHIRFYTAANTTTVTGTQRATIDSDGLKFNADTAADNALDDYEVGTFAAQVNDANITSSYTTGFYVKIGDLVNVTINMTCTATSGSGAVSFPLPFAVGNNITNGNKVYGGSATNMHTQVNFSTNYTTLAAHTWYGQTNVFMYQTGGGQTWSALNATHLTANQTGWVIDFCYSVA